MPTGHTLPDNPRLDWLRQRARALQRAVRAGDPDAAARVARHHPGGTSSFTLSTAQLVVAREYGFPSWPRLRRYLDLVADRGWDATRADEPAAGPADELCRLACLTYRDDRPERWEQAGRLLAEHPELTRDHIWAAAAAAQPATVDRLLAGDPALVHRRGGPYRWTPLFYLAYSRFDPAVPAEPVLTVARSLLAAGADPDEGYLWNGQPYPFTLLTGVFGEGELGPRRQPRHPHALAFARVLLDAGANPNDSQTLYNRQFGSDDDHLALLLEYGLGRDTDYPWREQLGDMLDRPAELLRIQLRWAIEHDLPGRVRLLVRHGVDFRSPYRAPAGGVAWLPDDGQTPVALAARCGNTAIVDFLVSQGAPLHLEEDDALVAAAFRADRREVERLRAAYPEAVERVRVTRPGLIVWAAANGRTETVALLVELGFDVNARGRGDVPVGGGVDTALHHAAYRGDLPTARLLLSLGADPNLLGGFHATPLGWAEHAGHQSMVELLAPLTRLHREWMAPDQ